MHDKQNTDHTQIIRKFCLFAQNIQGHFDLCCDQNLGYGAVFAGVNMVADVVG